MTQISNINIQPLPNSDMSSITATWDNGEKETFACPNAGARVISELSSLLNNATRVQAATADSLRKYVKGSPRRTRDADPEMAQTTKVTAELMGLMRRVAPKFNEWVLGDDARLAALDTLRLAPVQAVSAVNPRPLDDLSLADAVATLIAVADYMRANDIDPLPLEDGDRIRAINKVNGDFWNKGGVRS